MATSPYFRTAFNGALVGGISGLALAFAMQPFMTGVAMFLPIAAKCNGGAGSREIDTSFKIMKTAYRLPLYFGLTGAAIGGTTFVGGRLVWTGIKMALAARAVSSVSIVDTVDYDEHWEGQSATDWTYDPLKHKD